jgi:hypothetical protein
MKFQTALFCLVTILFAACSSQPAKSDEAVTAGPSSVSAGQIPIEKAAHDSYLICKAKKSRFHFDWTAAAKGGDQIDQNSVRYQFKSANRPAGTQGENLKVGECGWAGRALASTKKEKSEFTYKSLSEEATETFYKMRTGKVFKLPVRQSKNGMVVLPNASVTVLR